MTTTYYWGSNVKITSKPYGKEQGLHLAESIDICKQLVGVRYFYRITLDTPIIPWESRGIDFSDWGAQTLALLMYNKKHNLDTDDGHSYPMVYVKPDNIGDIFYEDTNDEEVERIKELPNDNFCTEKDWEFTKNIIIKNGYNAIRYENFIEIADNPMCIILLDESKIKNWELIEER